MSDKPCPRCGSNKVLDSGISIEFQCQDCKFIWGFGDDNGYYFPDWKAGNGAVPGRIVKVPWGCLMVGLTPKTEKAED